MAIVAIEHGSLCFHFKYHNILLNEKKIAVINPYEMHNASTIDAKSDGLYAMYLDTTWIEKIQNEFFFTNGFVNFRQTIIDSESFYNDFINLCKVIFSDTMVLEKEQYLLEFISKLISGYCDDKPHRQNSILFCDIKKYIDDNRTDPLSIEKISKEFLITPFHLIRIFKKELYLTPYQYILSHKIEYAKELLSSEMTIAEVSVTAGFSDQSHLYKYFKQTYSVSPSEYKSSLIE